MEMILQGACADRGKAASDRRTPGRCREFRKRSKFRKVLECGGPTPLFEGAFAFKQLRFNS